MTGAAGYIGSRLVSLLLETGYSVRAVDTLFFGGESLIGVFGHPRLEFCRGDIRDFKTVRRCLEGVDAVVHLAAIVGDPACDRDPALAREVNADATKTLFDLCHDTPQVERFVFASTCSNYGRSAPGAFVDETSQLNPLSLYAELKVNFEKYLLEANGRSDFAATSLRFATAHGLSPRPRFDLTVNEFTREITLGRTLKIYGKQFWRPYCHVEDLVRSCLLALESPAHQVRQKVYGVGDTNENYQKRMLADLILVAVPGARIEYVHKEEDPRDYRVDFRKIREELGFSATKRVPDGVREIHGALVAGLVAEPDSPRYCNTA